MSDVFADKLGADRVPVVAPDGKLGSVPHERYATAKAAGYRFQTPAEQEQYASQLKFGERPIAAAGAGAARALTLGASDVVLPATGLVEPETLKGLQEENPGASLAGDLGATAATLLVPGAGEATGPGLVAKLGRAVEGGVGATTRLGRVAAKTAAGVAEGSLFGAGNAVSDAALGDPQLNAEKLMSHVGLGAVLGGGVGALSGAVGEAARAVVPRAATMAGNAQGILDELANDKAVKATRATQAVLKNLGDAETTRIGQVLRERGHLGDSLTDVRSPEEMLKSITTDREQRGQEVLKQLGLDVNLPHDADQETATKVLKGALSKKYGPAVGQALEDIDASAQFPGGARPAYSEILKSLDDMSARVASNPAERDFAEPIIQKARGYIDELGARPVGKDNGFAMLNRVKSSLADDVNYGGQSTARSRVEKDVVRAIKEQIDSQIELHAGAGVSKQFTDAKRAYGLLSHGLEEGLGRKASTGADAIAEMAKKAGLATPEARLFDALGGAQSLAQSGAGRSGGIGMKDLLYGIAGGMAHPLGLAAGLGSMFLREHGDALVAKFADRLSKSPALAAAAQSFAQKAPAMLGGNFGRIMTERAALSPSHALAEHILRSQLDPEYSSTAQLAGLTPESPDEHAASVAKSTDIATLAGALQAHDDALEKHLDDAFAGKKSPAPPAVHTSQDFGAKRMRRDAVESHRQIVHEAAALVADPSALVERVANNAAKLGDVAPSVVAHLTQRAQVAAQYLAQAGAAPQKKGPLAPEWHPTHAEMHAFALKAEVVRDPMSVMRHAAAGMLTRSQVDALKAVYPTLARDMADRALMRLADNPKDVPYRARLMLQLLTGIDVDGTMSPAAIAANQKAIAAASAKAQPAPPKKMDLTVASRTATAGERNELQGRGQ